MTIRARFTLHLRILRSQVGLFLALLLVAVGLVFEAAPAKAVQAFAFPGKRILILHSYFKGFKWTDDEHLGITSVLEPAVGAGNF